MIGMLNNDYSIVLKFENGVDFNTVLDNDYKFRTINDYFIKNDMELGVIYIAVTGDIEYYIVKIRDKNNEIVIKLKDKELKYDKRPVLSIC